MDFLQQKEELENKIKNINNYWDDLKIKQEEKFKKREEYKEPKKHLYDAIYKILYLLKSKKLISQNMFENYIVKTNCDIKEAFLENKFLIFFYHLFKNIEFKDDTTYKISDKHIFTSFFEEMKESNKNNINIYEENDETYEEDKELDEKMKLSIKRIKGKKKIPLTYFIYEYEQYKMREKARIEEENTEEYKQKQVLQVLEEELKQTERVDNILKKILTY
jgi:hypothetical protein